MTFTKELIKNYKLDPIYRLNALINQKQKLNYPGRIRIIKPLTREQIIEKVKEKSHNKTNEEILKELKSPLKTEQPKEKSKIDFSKNKEFPEFIEIIKPSSQNTQKDTRILRIPEPRLPEKLQYLQPSETFEYVQLGKLDVLIKDSNVNLIECPGANEKVVVEGTMGRKPTEIILNQTEINNILNEFSSKSKIPISEGISRIALGNLILTLIKTENQIHFMIKKMNNLNMDQPPSPFGMSNSQNFNNSMMPPKPIF